MTPRYCIANISNLSDIPELDFVATTDRAIMFSCRLFNVRPHEIRSRRRARRFVRARWAVFWTLSETTALSLPDIGKLFDRDHTTVWHGIQSVIGLRMVDADYRAKTDQLLQQVGTAQ